MGEDCASGILDQAGRHVMRAEDEQADVAAVGTALAFLLALAFVGGVAIGHWCW